MKKTSLEKQLVILMFAMVVTVFSLAQRDTEKLLRLYNGRTAVSPEKPTATGIIEPEARLQASVNGR
jgi:hypothetical protein